MSVCCRMALVAVLAALVSVAAIQSDTHLFHAQCECLFRGLEVDDIRLRYAYDGVTVLYYDTMIKRYVAVQPTAQAWVDRQNSDHDSVASVPHRIESICDEIKQAARSSNTTLENKAPTHTRAFMQKKQGQMYLVCTAKNFFPRDIKARWVRNGKVADNGSDVTNVVPQSDGTFQVRSVRPLNGDSRGYICQLEHEAVDGKLQIPLEHKALVENEALIIVGAVLGILGLCTMVVTGILYCCTSEGAKGLNPQQAAKFNNRAGLCRLNTCSASVRSGDSNSSASSADELTKPSF
ncbi:HLA class II histocompatibility antigen, DR beta 4 chain-like [Hemitrygon akajei]|uniref:HLA class II histocompatibility antigen, DR beta 4 chain-like n=1 Tax=Hemitrygon akajei TaxID=2704970 RepID=UPI003BFA3779